MMDWRSRSLSKTQQQLLKEVLVFAHRYRDGQPEALFHKLSKFLENDQIRLRGMKERARFWNLPGFKARLELNPDALGLNFDFNLRASLESAKDDPVRQERIQAKAEERWLYLATALVHEGTHALEGLSWSRRSDEQSAYEAECRFLKNVYQNSTQPLVRNTARSLHADAVRDALAQEGLQLPQLLAKD